MHAARQCPFCGQPISAAQYDQLRERIRKAEDPALLQELEVVRQEILQGLKKNLEAEYAPIRGQLDAYIKRDQELNERSTQLALKEEAIHAEIAKRVSEKEKE